MLGGEGVVCGGRQGERGGRGVYSEVSVPVRAGR